MTITLSQAEYWDLFQRIPNSQGATASYAFPSLWGQGLLREYHLREELDLAVENVALTETIALKHNERFHPIEYNFETIHHSGKTEHRYALYGTGLAPVETYTHHRDTTISSINIHMEAPLLRAWSGDVEGDCPCLKKILRSPEEKYYEVSRKQTAAMQMVIQQITQCPFEGLTQRLYLESKIWELTALILEDLTQAATAIPFADYSLKADDLERIHYAGKILQERLVNPPSLMELAREIGINDHKLKVGFRQVFKTTVFGYLHDQRIERSRQLLESGEMTVTGAASAVGFANRGHFAAAFRRKFGINPSLYARQRKL
ncbi:MULTISPECIES: AraC family transcriptional regulator [Cyanophyceae]|uniref:helix-turn-helix transcriptional regulator n=1 Tax=Cyanophyceae TaxID=3028117 RepID=UPI00016DC378|nr:MULTISPECIES: AraC family transcriptional regulator [Cyanophyceae]ACB01144.1 transcriptional regulator, AraC family [Picosynechococcus sp. PCC 7002]SMH48205.1 transcriptional regulator, AraC family [Picosynechococcus sp. OG1]SMQ81249.1 transcriptional regulator, AraC family [Synechococcus sp. 7002]